MHGKTSTASQASTGGHARHAETARTDRGNSRARPARSAVPVPPSADDRENNFAGQWPLQSFLELGALPGAVPCARVHARQMLWEWGVTELADVTELVISELVTNAIQISRADAHAAPVRLWLLADTASALILVWDASPLPPVRMSSGANDENGRGLLLVDTLSAQWNWYFPRQPRSGKVVWALIRPE